MVVSTNDNDSNIRSQNTWEYIIVIKTILARSTSVPFVIKFIKIFMMCAQLICLCIYKNHYYFV